MMPFIRQFHGVRACVGLDDGECSGWLPAWKRVSTKGPLMFNISFAAVMTHLASMRLGTGKDVMDTMVSLKKRTGFGGSTCGRSRPGDLTMGYDVR